MFSVGDDAITAKNGADISLELTMNDGKLVFADAEYAPDNTGDEEKANVNTGVTLPWVGLLCSSSAIIALLVPKKKSRR